MPHLSKKSSWLGTWGKALKKSKLKKIKGQCKHLKKIDMPQLPIQEGGSWIASIVTYGTMSFNRFFGKCFYLMFPEIIRNSMTLEVIE